jgi:hypothetical protein
MSQPCFVCNRAILDMSTSWSIFGHVFDKRKCFLSWCTEYLEKLESQKNEQSENKVSKPTYLSGGDVT